MWGVCSGVFRCSLFVFSFCYWFQMPIFEHPAEKEDEEIMMMTTMRRRTRMKGISAESILH